MLLAIDAQVSSMGLVPRTMTRLLKGTSITGCLRILGARTRAQCFPACLNRMAGERRVMVKGNLICRLGSLMRLDKLRNSLNLVGLARNGLDEKWLPPSGDTLDSRGSNEGCGEYDLSTR